MFRTIDTSNFGKIKKAKTFGPVPVLQWLAIKDFVVDSSYQRKIGQHGRKNITIIVETFDWAKFSPVVVAGIEGGKYAIVDGQHRTTAASLLGIESVPCQIIMADQRKQAEAFAAVNGAVTKTGRVALYHAMLSSGDKLTKEVTEACKVAGVFVPKNRFKMRDQVGYTTAVLTLMKMYQKHGRDVLITSLMCLTQTGDGNPNCIRTTIVEALCETLASRKDWLEAGDALFQAMESFIFAEEWDKAIEGRHNVGRDKTVAAHFKQRIAEHLEETLKVRITAVCKEPRRRSTALVVSRA